MKTDSIIKFLEEHPIFVLQIFKQCYPDQLLTNITPSIYDSFMKDGIKFFDTYPEFKNAVYKHLVGGKL